MGKFAIQVSLLCISWLFLSGGVEALRYMSTSFLGLQQEYLDEDGNATRDLFMVSSDLDEQIRDLTQYEEDMDEGEDLLYIMGEILSEFEIEEKISELEETYNSINYNDPDYEEIIVVDEDPNLDDGTELGLSGYIEAIKNGESAEDIFG